MLMVVKLIITQSKIWEIYKVLALTKLYCHTIPSAWLITALTNVLTPVISGW